MPTGFRMGIRRGMEELVRPWVDVRSTPAAPREPIVPDVVNPEAYLEWGDASGFGEDFRADAANPAFSTRPKFDHPLHGTWTEEGRTWDDFQLSNPEDPGQFVIMRRTTAVALRGPNVDKESGRWPQIQFSFSNAGADQPPTYQNGQGDSFEPIVLSPLEEIVEVGWGGRYVIISILTEDMGVSMAAKLVLMEPNTGENSEDGTEGDFLRMLNSGGNQRESSGSQGDAVIHHPDSYPKEPPYTHMHPWEQGGTVPTHIYDGGYTISIAIDDGGPYAGMHLELLRSGGHTDQPNSETNPWVWELDNVGNCLVLGRHHEVLKAATGGVATIQNLLNYWNVILEGAAPVYQNITIKFYRRHNLPWDEYYYRPYAWWAGAIDVTKLFTRYYDHYMSNKPIRVGIHMDLDNATPDGKPTGKIRFAVYSGRMDATDPPSVAATISDGPYSDLNGGSGGGSGGGSEGGEGGGGEGGGEGGGG